MSVARPAALVVAIALAAACAGTPAGAPDILYVATPEQVGVEMLRLAAVRPQDIVYDLGSGDGRLVIAAAREGALKAGVSDRTEFLWQDIFQTEIAPATVVMLYLRQDVNLKLRPKLLRELRPGTRVVSHDFDMGDWRPDRTVRVKGPTREHVLYLWVIPSR